MKLRILGNKIRFRLSKTEVYSLSSGNTISTVVDFPIGDRMTYQVKNSTEVDLIELSYSANEIVLSVPKEQLNNWAEDSREGIYYKWDNDSFEVALEKDFQCLHKRPGEDESDNFQNPKMENNQTD